MVDAINLRSALSRIGWSASAQTAFTNEGFSSMDDVGLVTRDFLGKVCKKLRSGRDAVPAARGQPAIPALHPVDIPLLNEFKLYGMHLWILEKTRQGITLVPADFTRDVGLEYSARTRRIIEEKDIKSDDMVKMPDSFTKDTNWIQFKKMFVNFLSSKLGQNRAPLSYCVRDEDDIPHPDDVPDFDTDHDRMLIMTPHSGEAFAEDNGQVWSILKQLTIKGPAYAYISHLDRTRNGRSAFKALLNHYEGDSQMTKAKQEAYEDLKNADYKGERRNYTFEMYVNRHTKAYQTLEEYGEVISDEKKVMDFLDRIYDTSPAMVAGKAAVLGDPKKRSDFVETTNYLTNFIQSLPRQSARNISSTVAARRPPGRSPGRGNSRGNNHRPPRNLKIGNYEQEDWDKLSYDQRSEIRRRRAAAARKTKTTDNTKPRNASCVNSNDPKDKPNNEAAPTPQHAGDQFASPNKKHKSS